MRESAHPWPWQLLHPRAQRARALNRGAHPGRLWLESAQILRCPAYLRAPNHELDPTGGLGARRYDGTAGKMAATVVL
jgi:hypothetical protein